MNSEIKFRGIRIDNAEMVFGSLILKYGKCFICYKASVKKAIGRKDIWCETEVVPESVGQLTGLTDKNGVEIYEGNILRIGDVICEITWSDGSLQMITDVNQGRSPALQDRVKNFEIIGNSFTNPELLKQ